MADRISADEMEALKLLAQTGKRKSLLSPEIEKSLLAKGLVERRLAVWVVTSRGHAVIMRLDVAKEPDRRGD